MTQNQVGDLMIMPKPQTSVWSHHRENISLGEALSDIFYIYAFY